MAILALIHGTNLVLEHLYPMLDKNNMSASDDAGYNIDGKQNVDPNIFLPEDAEHTDGEGVTPENNTPKTGDEPKGDEPELDSVKPSVEDGDGSPETADVENGKKSRIS